MRADIAAIADGRVLGRAPGVTAILIVAADGTVLDFFHLWVEQATHTALYRMTPEGESLGEVRDGIDLLVGESMYLEPRLYFHAQELEGTAATTWSIDPPIAGVLRQGIQHRCRILGQEPGEGILTAIVAGVSVSVPLRVFSTGLAAKASGS